MRLYLVTAALLLTTSVAVGEVVTTTSAAVRPTQVEIGKYSAEHKRTSVWPREARAAGMSYVDYVASKFSAKAIPAVRDPQRNIRVLDGHHKLTALRVIEKERGIRIPVRVDIVKDYTGWSFSKYASHLVGELGKGYFGDRPPRSASARVRSLPRSFDRLGDNPLRAVLGVAFSNSGLEGSWFNDYIQFHVGKTMTERGLMHELERAGLIKGGVLASDAAADPKLIAMVTRLMFGDAVIVKMLQKNIKPADRELAVAAVERNRRSVTQRARVAQVREVKAGELATRRPRRQRAKPRTGSQRGRSQARARR